MVEAENIVPTEIAKASELSKKIWKFIIEVATSNSNCEHIDKAKQLLKEISQSL
jgi:hypothetical protein